MKIENMVLEAVKSELGRRGKTVSGMAADLGVARQSLFESLSGHVTEKAADRIAFCLRMDRAQFERLVLSEWRRAVKAGCRVDPPNMVWRHAEPNGSGMKIVG